LRTSCQSVVHIGDSTSESLVSPEYLPNSSQRLQAQYARVGVTNSIMEIQGATSIVETLPGEQNAYQVAQSLINQGYNGCWVIALGTNDTADVYVGSNVSMAARIQRMMSLLGNQPVLWVNVISLLSSGPYSEANMQQWNQALAQACPQYPNMRVFDWASVAQPSWFISDGIHYNSTGSAARAAGIANALAQGFPASAQTSGSVGHSSRGSGSPSCLVQ
jgi:lysophospholipase L1-like esterase